MEKEIIVRPAMLKDVKQILDIINLNAKKGTMLPKSKKEVLGMLANYSVAAMGNKVIGTCGFKIWVDESIEIISLATLKRFQGQGIGARLIQESLERGKNLGLKRFFAMTVAPKVFSKAGFEVVGYDRLSLKIWVDCSDCPRNASGPGDKDCNEQAVELLLD
ncbi:MAG: GNAT family N-acetyltransferase [Parcubacteria group bacterium]|nr:GNAT family N-acetyltransferase [Parcubacteria group bacterium]